jgi:hypothetical protein
MAARKLPASTHVPFAILKIFGETPEKFEAARRIGWIDECDRVAYAIEEFGRSQITLTPLLNHWWNIALHVPSRELGR